MFVNDIFKKKQITEANVKKPQPYNEPGWTRKLSKQELDALAGYNEKSTKDIKKEKQNKKQDVKEAGPFSYGAKKPRKSSVADLAAQKRREQERGKQPIEPKDQRVGTARVTKDVAEGRGNIEALRTELMGEYLNIYYNALDGWNMTDHIINLQDVYGRVKRSRDPVLQQTYNLLMDHAEESIDVQASAALKAIRILGDEPNYTPPPRPPMSPEDSARADAFVNQFLAALVSHGIKTHPDWQKNNNKGVAEGNLAEFAPTGGGSGRWYSDDQLYDIIGEDWLEAFDVSGDQGNIDLRGERARLFLAQEAEAWLTDRGYRVNVLDVKDDGDELSWYIQGPLYRGLAEGEYASQFQSLEDAIIYAKDKVKSFRDPADGIEIYAMPDGGADLVHTMNSNGRRQTIQNGGKKLRTIYANDEQGLAEGSTQEKLYKRHQELRKKSGLPDPDYYKELKTTYDLPDDERHAKQKEIKQKYKVTNEDREQYIEELQRAGYEIVTEKKMTCPECGGAAYSDRMLAEKQDACYHKVKSRYKVWPSAYASGALVRCRKKGAKNWGNKSKK